VIAKLPFLPFVPVPHINAVFRPIHVEDAARQIVAVSLASTTASPSCGPTPLVGPERLTAYEIAARVLGAHGINVVRVPGWITDPLVALVSALKLPGLPAELRQMLLIDNAGTAPENTSGLVRFSHWVRNTSRPARPVAPATLGDSRTD
jgi:uncharacterized protein YbjT (DUF2867 family)